MSTEMSYDIWLWITFAVMALITVALRGSFILLGDRVRLPDALQQALRYAPAAALAALVVPDLLIDQGQVTPFNPKFAAGLMVILIVTRSRNPWLPFILGMAVLLGLRKGLGW